MIVGESTSCVSASCRSLRPVVNLSLHLSGFPSAKPIRLACARGIHLELHSTSSSTRLDMQKLSNFTGQARHMMTPAAFGMGRSHLDNGPQQAQQAMKRATLAAPNVAPLSTADAMVTLSFNVPFSSTLAGPDPEDIIHASMGAAQKWTHPEGADENAPVHKLPVHVRNVDQIRSLCKSMSETSGGQLEASVTSTEPKTSPAAQRLSKRGLVTNVCVSGNGDVVHKIRAQILNDTPIALVQNSGQVSRRARY